MSGSQFRRSKTESHFVMQILKTNTSHFFRLSESLELKKTHFLKVQGNVEGRQTPNPVLTHSTPSFLVQSLPYFVGGSQRQLLVTLHIWQIPSIAWGGRGRVDSLNCNVLSYAKISYMCEGLHDAKGHARHRVRFNHSQAKHAPPQQNQSKNFPPPSCRCGGRFPHKSCLPHVLT